MTAKPANGAEAPPSFLSSLYAFVRDHLVVVNGVVLASGSLCAALEALAPGLSPMTLCVRVATALLVAWIVLSAIVPGLRRAAPGAGTPMSAPESSPPRAPGEPPRQLLLWEETSEPAR